MPDKPRASSSHSLERLDALSARAIDAIAARRWRASLFLLALSLAAYLPGVVRLPAVDRTEIVFASASRQMLAEGNLVDPRFREKQLQGKPIGAFWAQMGVLAATGDTARGHITTYRLPSLAGVVLAVLATFWLLAPVLGRRGALVAAALFAVTPLLALEANLAVADGVVLGAAVVAQLALLRIYLAASVAQSSEGAFANPNVRGSPPPNLPHKGGGTASQERLRETGSAQGDTPPCLGETVPPPLWGRLGGGESQSSDAGVPPNPNSSPQGGYAAAGATLGLALLFWAAQGFGILLNALAVPLLSLSTLAALVFFDRRLGWLKRLHPLAGVPLMLAIGAPWLIARAIADGGVPFQGLAWDELLAALGGSQADNWKAAPGSFTGAFLLGFLPGTALLIPALWRLWLERGEALGRFLLAWLIGYLAYLELVSGKPALYSVEALFPAAAAALVLAMTTGRPRVEPLAVPHYSITLPWPIPAVLILGPYAVLLWFAEARPAPAIVLGAILVAALFALGAEALRRKLAAAWVALSVGGFAVFLAFTFGVFLPHLEKAWPAERIAEAVAPLRACAPGPIGIVGFREPSATFVLGGGTILADPARIAAWAATGERHVILVERRWQDDVAKEVALQGAALPARLGCVEAFNVMRGCPLSFSIFVTGDAKESAAACRAAPAHACPDRQREPESPKTTARCR